MPDADLDATVNAIMGGAFGSAGERCMALPVVVAVGDETADRLIERLKPLIAALRIGLSCAAKMKMKWARLFHAHQQKVLGYIDKGVSEGATLVMDGRNYSVAGYPEGFYVGGSCLITSRLR